MSKQYYLNRILDYDNKGWLEVIIKNEGFKKLPFSTKLSLIKREEDFETFKILEGNYKNKIAFVPYMVKGNNNSYSYSDKNFVAHRSKILVIKEDQQMYINDKIYNIIANKQFLSPGKYCIDFPIFTTKDINSDYLDEQKGGSRFAQTWFPFLSNKDLFIEKYIHFGSYSEGCITIPFIYGKKESNAWREIYFSLINSRSQNGKLAYLEVE